MPGTETQSPPRKQNTRSPRGGTDDGEYPTEEGGNYNSHHNGNTGRSQDNLRGSEQGENGHDVPVNAGSEDDSSTLRMLPINYNAPPPPPPPRDLNISPILFILMMLATLVFTVVSIGIPWYRVRQYQPTSSGGKDTEGLFYLFKSTWKVDGEPTVTTNTGDLTCNPVKRRVRVMESFSIVAAAMSFITLVLGVLNVTKEKSSRVVYLCMIVFAAFTFGALTITISFNFNVYLWSFTACGEGTSYHSQLYEPYVGFGFITTAWVISGFAGIIGANKLLIPLDARAVDKSIHAFTFLALVSMLFSVVACPIPHWFYKNGETRLVNDVMLWREQEGKFDWDLLAPNNRTSLYVADLGCDALIRYFRAAESFSIISIFFNACAGATGMLLWVSLVGTRLPALIFSWCGFVTSVVAFALELKIYYGDWCDGMYAYKDRYYVLTAGCGLAAAAFCIMLFASICITITYVLTEKYFPALRPNKTAKQVAVEEMQ